MLNLLHGYFGVLFNGYSKKTLFANIDEEILFLFLFCSMQVKAAKRVAVSLKATISRGEEG